MKICIAGNGNVAVECLYIAFKYFDKKDITVVLNGNDKLKNTWFKSLGFYAKKENILISQLPEVQNISDIIYFSIQFDLIIKPSLFKSKKLYNIHFSYLPYYKGMYPSSLPIIHGEKYSGVTFHKIDRGIDTGDIIYQIKNNIEKLNCRELYFQNINSGIKILRKHFENIINDNFISFQQPSLRSTYFSRTALDLRQNNISANQCAYQIHQFIKALTFREYQIPVFNLIPIATSVITNQKSLFKPGTVIRETEGDITISSVDYDITLVKDFYAEFLDCCKSNDYSKAKQIIKYIKNVDETNENAWTPLMIASFYGASDVIKLLIHYEANVNAKNLNGTTVFMFAKENAVSTKDISLLKYLIDNGANIYSKDIWNKNVFDYLKNEDKNLISAIKKYYNDKVS